MSTEAAGVYRAYLLRLWQVESGRGRAWRASLEDVRTGDQHGFASLEALLAYLQEQGDASEPGEGGDPEGR